MTAVSRRVHLAQITSLAFYTVEKLPEPAFAAPTHSTCQRRANPDPNWFEKWRKVQEEEERRVLAMLRQRIGPDGDLKAAYRTWWDERNRQHTRDRFRCCRI